jgi:hypothetical protein
MKTMKRNTLGVTALAVVAAFAITAFVPMDTEDASGGFSLSASLPGSSDIYGEAVLVITTKNCAEPHNAEVAATVVEVRDGKTSKRELKLRNVGPGEYALDEQWSADATMIVANGSYDKYRAGIMIGLSEDVSFEGKEPWVGRLKNGYPTLILFRHTNDVDVAEAMAD